jgi:hypothetical protein
MGGLAAAGVGTVRWNRSVDKTVLGSFSPPITGLVLATTRNCTRRPSATRSMPMSGPSRLASVTYVI